MKSKKIWLFAIPVVILVIVGGAYMSNEFKKNSEEARNHKYEKSLVKALKNSYADIEEIKLSSPNYAEVPGNWSCFVQLTFSNGEQVSYNLLGHTLSTERNRSAVVSEKEGNLLEKHFGETKHKVKVTYSNKEVREE
ncbi:hypothetical protein [Streptococcus oricebi]|uniref:Secreted protein n=1 Tax=Streptococcus oricebi TaxID=1547447 RepID=A0ABS5B719_9STRE|nr:hypothetical protein [Streptococcus oricebi]MBP2624296.1 hypothetical protein [Streptococcus oricebi]